MTEKPYKAEILFWLFFFVCVRSFSNFRGQMRNSLTSVAFSDSFKSL